MLFNSFEYLIFLPIIFLCYWTILGKKKLYQNIFLLIASYFFYGLWDWRFLTLIIASTLVDFIIGQKIFTTEKESKRKLLLWLSILFNIGVLFFFKYYNFFIDSWVNLFSFLNYTIESTWTLKIILPVGISFYTFQTMSYSLDVYNRKTNPTKDFISFATYVAYFPQLVAGPIEKASNLLPQIIIPRKFNYHQCTDGLKLILWGLLKKMVIADALAPIVDDIFTNYASYPSSTLFLGALLFSFQIYGDFSGYSDIAIGTSKLFGIELISNFKFPYFSKNISEFWQRWHISLSSWFKEYVYFPLGGSKKGSLKSFRNIMIVFLISGFWHGANWTYIAWGTIHAVLYIPIFFYKKKNKITNEIIEPKTVISHLNNFRKTIQTFLLVTITWVFFRATSIHEALNYLKRLITNFNFEVYNHPFGYRMLDFYILIILFILFEFLIRKDERRPFNFKSKTTRFITYLLVVFTIILFYDDQIDRSFIYFQF